MNIRFLMCDEDLAPYWPDVSRMLRPVVEKASRGEFSLGDIRGGVDSGKIIVALCSIGDKPTFAGAFEFTHYPQYMNVNILAAGGRLMGEFAEIFWETFMSWAKGAGAKEIQALCSPAMARMLARYGFKAVYQQVRIGL